MNNLQTKLALKPDTTYTILICCVLIVATLLVYRNIGNYPFNAIDDDIYVYDNPYVKTGLSGKNIAWAFDISRDNKHEVYFHPLTWLSHMMDCHVFGLDAGMHHWINVMLHIFNTLLLFLVLQQTTGALRKSAFVAMLFAVHPINVESVAWIAERKNVLSTLFWMLTMLAYAWYAMQPGIRRYLLVLVSLTLGLMSKPMLITLPFALLLMDFWPLGRLNLFGTPETNIRSNGQKHFKQVSIKFLILEKIPLICVSVITAVITLISLHYKSLVIETNIIPISYRFGNAAISYIKYAYKIVWPQNLAIFYPKPYSINGWYAIYAGITLFIITGIAIWAAKKKPYFIVGWLWFLGTLFPAIGLVQGGAWPELADRFAYIPAIGLFLIFTWEGAALLKILPGRKVLVPFLATTTITALMLVCNYQVSFWSDNIKLLQHANSLAGDDIPPETNFLVIYNLACLFGREKKYDQAIIYLEKTVATDPTYRSHAALAENYLKQGQIEKAVDHLKAALTKDFGKDTDKIENIGKSMLSKNKPDVAISYYNRMLELKPDSMTAHYGIGCAFIQQQEYDTAITHFNKILKNHPNHVKANIKMAIALEQSGRIGAAIDHYQTAIRYAPENTEAHNNLGVLLLKKDRLDEAENHFKTVLWLTPDDTSAITNLEKVRNLIKSQPPPDNQLLELTKKDPEALYRRGLSHQHAGHLQKAIKAYQSAIDLDSEHVNARFGLALIYARQAKYDDAVLAFKDILSLQPNNPKIYYNLACIRARQNKTEQAVEWLKKSVDHGYNNWKNIRTDPDLKSIHETSYFKSLMDDN